MRKLLWLCTILLSHGMPAFAASFPSCRLNDSAAKKAEAILDLAAKAYGTLGKTLPFDSIAVNPRTEVELPRRLKLFVVSDATVSTTGKDGCILSQPAVVKNEELDDISVRGGCIALAGVLPEIHCSADAVAVFGDVGNRTGQANPALLYVLAHELGHILQRRRGEYAGRVEPIQLRLPAVAKLDLLRQSCEPGRTKAEEEADALAAQVLIQLLPAAPFRESTFSRRGSILWGIDQLHLAANQWRKIALEREFISQKKPHKSFIATEFPAPAEQIDASAKRFVCDVLTKNKGTVLYPGNATQHPTLEVRMQRVADLLRPIAAGLPKADTQQEYQPVTTLQENLSDIFTFIYRENGVYQQAVQDAICTRVNSEAPTAGCVASGLK